VAVGGRRALRLGLRRHEDASFRCPVSASAFPAFCTYLTPTHAFVCTKVADQPGKHARTRRGKPAFVAQMPIVASKHAALGPVKQWSRLACEGGCAAAHVRDRELEGWLQPDVLTRHYVVSALS